MKMLLVSAAIAAALAVPAAASAGTAPGGADYCTDSEVGCTTSMTATICAGHGSFGAFGKNWNFAGGASGDRTAFNNSTLCGNPQGAAGELNP
jgi:hypothetical protein